MSAQPGDKAPLRDALLSETLLGDQPEPDPAPGPSGRRTGQYFAPALEKGIDIIELLAAQPAGLSISEIAQGLGRSISEVFRVIMVMERRQWLRRTPEGDRYVVSYRVLDIAFRATPAQELAHVAAPVMHELSAQTNQSCHLVVMGEGRGLVIQRQESPGPIGLSMRLGIDVDLSTSASGHVLLAFAPPERLPALIGALPPSSAMPVQTLLERLDIIRQQGFEMQASKRAAGVTDLSFPVFRFDGSVVAALAIPFLSLIDGTQRSNLDLTRQMLAEAAGRISAGMGWMGDAGRPSAPR